MHDISMHTRTFDESNQHWMPNPDFNRLFVLSQQNWANDRLRAKGYLFLNDVYEMLGLERTSVGQLVGWSREKNENSFVDFGIATQDGSSFALEFNIDGEIIDTLP